MYKTHQFINLSKKGGLNDNGWIRPRTGMVPASMLILLVRALKWVLVIWDNERFTGDTECLKVGLISMFPAIWSSWIC